MFLPGESQGQQSLVGHDWSDLAAAAAECVWVNITGKVPWFIHLTFKSFRKCYADRENYKVYRRKTLTIGEDLQSAYESCKNF